MPFVGLYRFRGGSAAERHRVALTKESCHSVRLNPSPTSAPLTKKLTQLGRSRLAMAVRVSASVLVLLAAFALGFYPAVTTARVALSSSLRAQGQVAELSDWFMATRQRYDRWAADYRATQHAAGLQHDDVAATEWPMFGSVFYLLSAEELLRTKQVSLTDQLRASLKGAAELVADPVSGTWVRQKWGEGYLEKENVFYRMLLILGLNSYGMMTNDRAYASLVEKHAQGLSKELAQAPYHVLDDYPGECYPNDVIWAAAAIARVETLPVSERAELSRNVVASMTRLSDNHSRWRPSPRPGPHPSGCLFRGSWVGLLRTAGVWAKRHCYSP